MLGDPSRLNTRGLACCRDTDAPHGLRVPTHDFTARSTTRLKLLREWDRISSVAVGIPVTFDCRLAAMLSQRELATRAGVSHVTIARLEGGQDAHHEPCVSSPRALSVTLAEPQHQTQR